MSAIRGMADGETDDLEEVGTMLVDTSRTRAGRLMLSLALALAILAAQATEAVAARDKTAEAQMVNLINQARTSDGLAPLSPASDMAEVAHDWSVNMALTDTMLHNPDYGVQICCWQLIAENVGYHSVLGSVSETVERMHDLFMGSPGHRANILNDDVNQVGVGVEIQNGILWVTVNFRQHDDSGTSEPEPSPEPTVKPKPKPAPEPEPKPEPASAPAPAPQPAPEPEPEPVDPTRTHTYLLLQAVELLEDATGL